MKIYKMSQDTKETIIVLLITTVVFFLVAGAIFGAVNYRCSHNEDALYYGDDDYCFVMAYVDCGRSSKPRCGVVMKTDYQKWVNGDNGTIFLYSPSTEGSGQRINISKIVSLTNYGSKPDWLPMNFWFC